MGTACEQPSGGGGGGGSVTPQTSTPLVHTLTSTSSNVVIKITETNKQPSAKAVISPATGNYYWVFLNDVLINQGTITVSGFTITFSTGSFTLTLNGDSYTLSGTIPNSQGGSISGPLTFTGSTSGGKTGNLVGKWINQYTSVLTFTATKFECVVNGGSGHLATVKGTYKLSGSTITYTVTSITGSASTEDYPKQQIAWIDANTMTLTNEMYPGSTTLYTMVWTRIK
jgi:hypothetical protein